MRKVNVAIFTSETAGTVGVSIQDDAAQLPRGRYLLASLTGNLEGSIELMVLRERH